MDDPITFTVTCPLCGGDLGEFWGPDLTTIVRLVAWEHVSDRHLTARSGVHPFHVEMRPVAGPAAGSPAMPGGGSVHAETEVPVPLPVPPEERRRIARRRRRLGDTFRWPPA